MLKRTGYLFKMSLSFLHSRQTTLSHLSWPSQLLILAFTPLSFFLSERKIPVFWGYKRACDFLLLLRHPRPPVRIKLVLTRGLLLPPICEWSSGDLKWTFFITLSEKPLRFQNLLLRNIIINFSIWLLKGAELVLETTGPPSEEGILEELWPEEEDTNWSLRGKDWMAKGIHL